MSDLFLSVQDFTTSTVIYRIILAFFIGGLIGIERGKHGRPAGLRTHILICLGGTLSSLLGLYIEKLSIPGAVDPTRIAAQVIASTGVLGAGSILIKNRDVVTGLTTAVGLWSTVIIGIAIGFGFYEGALGVAVLVVISMSLLNYLEISKQHEIRIYIEISDAKKLNQVLEKLEEIDNTASINIGPAKSNSEGSIGVYLKTINKRKDNIKQITNELIKKILKINSVVYAIQE